MTRFEGGQVVLTTEAIEEQFASERGVRARRPKRRATRLADIEALQKELQLQVRAAFEHATASLDLTGTPKLLPRPTKADLGKRAGVPPHTVSRCVRDKHGRDLRWLWDLAGDLDRILEYGDRTISSCR